MAVEFVDNDSKYILQGIVLGYQRFRNNVPL